MRTGNLLKLEHCATHDGPGIRLVVFLKGCPLHCLWCHTPESQNPGPEFFYKHEDCIHCGTCGNIFDRSNLIDCRQYAEKCPAGALHPIGIRMKADEIIREAEKERIFLEESGGGITISGGEPLFQPDFTLDLLRLAADRGFHCCVETSGCGEYSSLHSWIPFIGIFLYDYKATDPALHRTLTGTDNALILENLNLLSREKTQIILRCPLIPGINDQVEHLRGIADLAERLDAIMEVHVIPYHPMAKEKYRELRRKMPECPDEFPSSDIINHWIATISAYTARPVLIP